MDTKITTIEELNLSSRNYAFLRRKGINSLEQLLNTTEEELLNGGCCRNLGDIKAAEDIIQHLKNLDISLISETPEESKYADTKILDIDIADLGLETNICDILFENNIEKVRDIVSYTELEIFTMLGNELYFNAINKKLYVLGLKFSKSEDNIKESARRISGQNEIKRSYAKMNVDELAKKLAKELLKDQGLKMKTLVFFEDKQEMLDEFYDEVLHLRDAWCEKFDSLSERMQESSRGEKIGEIYELLESITTSLEEADSYIEEVKEKLEDNE